MRLPALVLRGAAVAVLAAAALTACQPGYTDGARPGVAYTGGTSFDAAHHAVVQLPLGALTIETGRPEQSIETFGTAPGRAADGTRWVPVDWSLAGDATDDENDTAAYQFQVTLVADGRRYDLQAGQASDSDEAASKYTPIVTQKSLDVVVQGDGEHLQLEVEYDGVTQTVDVDSGKIDSGVAAPLYKQVGATALSQMTCPLMSAADERDFEASQGTTCTIGTAQKTPYVGGLGWVSSPSQTWVLVPLDIMLIEFDSVRGNGRYSDFDVKQVRVTIDGKAPTTEILRYRDNDRLSATRDGVLVFRTEANPKSLHITTVVATRNEYRTAQTQTFRSDRTYALS